MQSMNLYSSLSNITIFVCLRVRYRIVFMLYIQVTKEVQVWLKQKQSGRVEDLSESAVERDIATRVASYERVHNELYEHFIYCDSNVYLFT